MLPVAEAPVVFRVVHLPTGGWSLEKSDGVEGGLFTSKHAALSYACSRAEGCAAALVSIELRESARNLYEAGPES